MKKWKEKYELAIKNNSKASLIVYVILRFLVILCLVRQVINGNIENALLCVLSLILFLIPAFIEKTFKVEVPSTLEIIILLFIFSAEILGEINNFYGVFRSFDTVLHTINGFLAASVGFSLIYLLNEKLDTFNLSPLFVSIVAFCFSMTIGVCWEFFEYGMDKYFNLDMQKDTLIDKFNTVELDETKSNVTINVKDIDYTILYDKNDRKLVKLDKYLDIGLIDTMEDLVVNFIGASVFSVFGYLYIVNKDKFKLAGLFLTKKRITK